MATLRARLLKRLGCVRPEATMCPGRLSRDCGTTLAEARGDLLALARARKITLSQGGKTVAPEKLKGPFRVRLKTKG